MFHRPLPYRRQGGSRFDTAQGLDHWRTETSLWQREAHSPFQLWRNKRIEEINMCDSVNIIFNIAKTAVVTKVYWKGVAYMKPATTSKLWFSH